jgi:cytochrome c biogenesis protein CcmG, thiol:disulfide interchange protein DsbE
MRRRPAALALASLALASLLSGAPAAGANSLQVGEAAPPAALVTLDGQRISTEDLIGHVVILTFWATWCGPCRQELPLLSAYASEHAAQGLIVLGFSLDGPEDMGKVRAIAKSLSFPSGLVSASRLPGYGRIWHIPVNFTIDRRGRLVNDGWRDKQAAWTADRLQRIVAPLLIPSEREPNSPAANKN